MIWIEALCERNFILVSIFKIVTFIPVQYVVSYFSRAYTNHAYHLTYI